jgi:hypothetical protein
MEAKKMREASCHTIHKHRKMVSVLFSLLFLCIGVECYGAVTCYVPAQPNIPGQSPVPMPAYFSSTLCGITGSATTNTGFINRIQMLINNEIVKEHIFDGVEMPYPASPVPISSAFDSTHFPDGQTITVTVKAWDTQGNFNQASNSAPAYNKAYVFGNQKPPDGTGTLNLGKAAVIAVNPIFQQANHSILPSTSLSDQLWQLKNGSLFPISFYIPLATVFYAWTHGLPGKFGDSSAAAAYDANKWITDSELGFMVVSKGSNFPPYNFAFPDACRCAFDDTLSVAFQTGAAGYSFPNRAFLGYITVEADSQFNVDWSVSFLTKLVQGKFIQTARFETLMAIGPPKDSDGLPVPTEIFSDLTYKLHGLYGAEGLAWHD